MPKTLNRPIILGIVGDSATGKTTLSSGVAKILSEDRCTTICTDDYHRYDRSERRERGISALDPRANHIDILEQHLQLLRRGQPILKPVYDHSTGTRFPPQEVSPKDFVIAEGLLGYTTRAMRDCFDVKIYLDPEEDLRIKWKIYRDTTRRGYNREQVLASLERRTEDSPTYIHPQRMFADIVIRFQKPNGANGSDANLDVQHILRPTLPHPDFSPLFDGSGGSGLHLEMARDKDGKPVDMLQIEGGISDKRAERIEDLLWTLLPEAGHLRDQVGRYDTASGESVSHPLALTQLIVAFHMVKAAMGIHAV
ncbi:phosphoribulokinase [bacterium BMS3Bbin10]|nr:phosphoribulokinase [bacterium BMS3Bbin10]HDL17021.1 phosphoribulokinase [Hyphomicrobiales bacterium]